MFEKNYTVKWHDTDAFRRVRPTQLLVYMQETSNYHMKECGPSLDALRDELGLAFILSKTRIAIYEDVHAFDNICVKTWTAPSKAYAMPRFFRITRGSRTVAEADTLWALVDINTKQLVSADHAESKYAFVHGEPPTLCVPQRFKIPRSTELDTVGSRKIVYSDLDYNMHMNNTKYADMLCDFLPLEDTGRVGGIFMSYVKEAAFGDTLTVTMRADGNDRFFRTKNSSGEVCLEAHVVLSRGSDNA